jgi:hypothetical protein
MSSRDLRFEILRFNSGATLGAVRTTLARFHQVDQLVVLVRRQGVGAVTWHRISARRLIEIVGSGPEGDVLSEHLTLDSVNKVPATEIGEAVHMANRYGVLLLHGEPIAFMEGSPPSALAGTSRSTGEPTARPSHTSPSPPPGAVGESSTIEPRGERTFSAFPVIDAPTTVLPNEVFEVTVGVAAHAVRHTSSLGLFVSDLNLEQETVTLKVMVTGPFRLAVGSANVGDIEVSLETLAHRPLVTRFLPDSPPDTYDPRVGAWTATITAAFFYEGAFIGEGHREIRVNQLGARHVTISSNQTPVTDEGTELLLAKDTVDVIISIQVQEPGSAGRFRVRLFSKHLRAPVDAGTVYLGENAKVFAARLIEEVDYTIASPLSDETMKSFGTFIADKLPDAVCDTLSTVWEAMNPAGTTREHTRIPDVLLLTDDWAVPWELMSITLDESVAGFLGAQVNLGRWPAKEFARLKAEVIGVQRLGVMVGHYQDARGVRPLPRAEEEGRKLEETYNARLVNADPATLNQLLAGRLEDGFEFEGLHFAGHGVSDPAKGGAYLMYSNGARIGIWALGSAPVAAGKSAFLFVNACQVGSANETLGEYAGLAGLAIRAGFRGFVAPLWSVSDDIAQQISLGLYEASVRGESVASYLRTVRAHFREIGDQPAHSTYMAYVFFGHPALRLGGPQTRRVD